MSPKSFFIYFILAFPVGFAVMSGCNRNISPSVPFMPGPLTSTPTFIPTATSTFSETPTTTPHLTPTMPAIPPNGIFWSPCAITKSGNAGASANCLFFMSVNGVAESTCAVTLTTPSGNVPFYFVGGTTYGVYYPTIPIVYQPGGTYTMTTITSIGTATATLTAPGGGLAVASDGSTASWNLEGNEDYINIWGRAGFTFRSGNSTSDVDSPFMIPASAYPVSGTYSVEVAAQNTNHNVIGAAPGSYFLITEQFTASVTK